MKDNVTYFKRNRGEWNWIVQFHITNWPKFLRSQMSVVNKLRLVSFVMTQRLMGFFSMWTSVIISEDSMVVHHSTKIKKFGVIFLRSEKSFFLDQNGSDLLLKGSEYYWPRACLPHEFKPLRGSVEKCTTRAIYQMPFLGISCDCQAYLEPTKGEIVITTPWLRGKFDLNEESMNVLRARFAEIAVGAL